MNITFLPQTPLGKWSAGLTATFLIFIGLLALFAASGQTFHDNPWLTIPVFLVYSASISSFIVGLISIIAKKERSFLVYLVVGADLLFIVFEAGDILFGY
jgi:hypothetical protein